MKSTCRTLIVDNTRLWAKIELSSINTVYITVSIPCTEEEFSHICPDIDTLLDVKVTYCEQIIIKATQLSINNLVETLKNMII